MPGNSLALHKTTLISDVTQPWEIGVATSAPKIIAAKCLPSTPMAGGNPEYVGRIRLPQRPGGAGWGIGAVDGHAAAGHGLSQRNVGLRFANPTYMLPSA